MYNYVYNYWEDINIVSSTELLIWNFRGIHREYSHEFTTRKFYMVNSPWGIWFFAPGKLGNSRRMPENLPWGIPRGEFPTENSSWEIGFTVGSSSDSSWRIWECNIKMRLSMYAKRQIVNLKQIQRLVPLILYQDIMACCHIVNLCMPNAVGKRRDDNYCWPGQNITRQSMIGLGQQWIGQHRQRSGLMDWRPSPGNVC